MRYVLTNKEMREADEHTIEEKGMPASVLMGGAGSALAAEVELLSKAGRVLCVCGGGNNGGDGFVCARILKSAKRDVDILCVADKFSHECEAQRRKWIAIGGEIVEEMPTRTYAVIVDCLFGTGFHGEVTGKEKAAILEIEEKRRAGAKVLSADIPSGVNGENGVAAGVAVRADVTLCIGELKAGALLCDGVELCGKVKRADVGIELPKGDYAVLADDDWIGGLLPPRKRNSHKGSYGRAAIVAGSVRYTGAAYLAAAACLKSGAGYTSLFLPKAILPYYILKAPEVLLCPVCEGEEYAFNEENMRPLLSCESVAYGMGMGVSEEVYKGAAWLLANYEGKLLLDADGLNSIAAYGDIRELCKKKKGALLLTPHAKEFSRISGFSLKELFEGGTALLKEFALQTGCTLLLKGATTTVTDGERVAYSVAGNSGQAKGGSGDALAGIIAALLAQGSTPFDGALCGAHLAGRSAELAARNTGEYALTATDTLAHLGKSFLLVAENTNKEGGEE